MERTIYLVASTNMSSLLQINNPQQAQDNPKNPTFCDKFIRVIDDMIAGLLVLFFRHPARDRNDFLNSYNARVLTKAGIQFKSSSDKITFDKHSHTLFLPKIVISDTYTEVMMRNLLAVEFNDANLPKNVTQYVELMDCLIDAPEDVALLRKREVIKRHSMMITGEQVAKMWDGMARPLFFAGFEEQPQAIKSGIREALNNKYYRSKVKKWWAEFCSEHLSRPWKAFASRAAVLVDLLTAAQTSPLQHKHYVPFSSAKKNLSPTVHQISSVSCQSADFKNFSSLFRFNFFGTVLARA